MKTARSLLNRLAQPSSFAGYGLLAAGIQAWHNGDLQNAVPMILSALAAIFRDDRSAPVEPQPQG